MAKIKEASSKIGSEDRWFFFISKFCGINYFTLPINRNGSSSMTLKDVCGLLVYSTVILWLGGYNALINLADIRLGSPALNQGIQLTVTQMSLHMVFTAAMTSFTHRTIWRMLVDLHEFDSEVSLLLWQIKICIFFNFSDQTTGRQSTPNAQNYSNILRNICHNNGSGHNLSDLGGVYIDGFKFDDFCSVAGFCLCSVCNIESPLRSLHLRCRESISRFE